MRDWQECWRRTWRDLGLALPAAGDGRVLADLLARYAETQRHYHMLQHLDECFSAFELLRSQAARPGEIALAIWFHDAVYDPQRRDNEARSARLALDCLRTAGAARDCMERVEKLIDATRGHESGTDPDCAILLDVDLAILGAAPSRFLEYERQIRAEYAHVPEDAYTAGRAKVLRGFAARPRIYATALFHERLEEQARENLARSLAA